MLPFKSTVSGATPAQACSALVFLFVPVEREHAGSLESPAFQTLKPKIKEFPCEHSLLS